MSDGPPSWELYRSFLEVMRDGSLSGAARRLALTQPTLGRHIDALEAALGIALFTRSPRGLTATQAARELMPHAEAMAAASAALLRVASGEASAEVGTVRLTASEIIGCEVLPMILSDFRAAHQRIDLELVLSNRQDDLLRRDADIAVRMLRPTQNALVMRRIGKVKIGLYAHRRYVEACGLPQTIDELAQHGLIGFDRDDRSFRSVETARLRISRESFFFRCDSDLGQLAALRAGLGIGGCQVNLAKRDADLVPVLAKELMFEIEMWLAMHEDLRASRRIRLLFDHLVSGLTRYVQGR